jgi:hypothetical protein
MSLTFTETILYKYPVQYFFCKPCGFLQTEKPYWLDEAYGDAIARNDTGLVQRNLLLASKLVVYLFLNLKPRASYLDIAGGYGMLTRLMRDFGFNYFWSDPYCKNLHAVGFEKSGSKEKFLAISAFEVLEHVEDPVEFITNHLKSNDCKTIILSTDLFAGDHPPLPQWAYYSFSSGQHISFFSLKALEKIAKKLNLNFYSFNKLHILSDQPLRFGLLVRIMTKSYIAPLVAILIRAYLGTKTYSDSEKNIQRNKTII